MTLAIFVNWNQWRINQENIDIKLVETLEVINTYPQNVILGHVE